jgi:tetratricopeptide (TPR) repeat protein
LAVIRSVGLAMLILILLASCAASDVPGEFRYLGSSYYHDISRLISEADFAGRYVLMEKLIRRIYEESGLDDLRSFIHQYVMHESEDPYNSYYFLLLGDFYFDEFSPLSEYYYSRLLSEYPDVILDGYSTHFRALNGLLRQVNDSAKRISYYERLLSDFPGNIDEGLTWYYLAQEYRSDGRFDDYYLALDQFHRNFPETEVPGIPDIHQQVSEELAFHYNDRKDWTVPNLNTLIANISSALRSRNPRLLERYRAKENFFAMSRFQEITDQNARPDFDIGLFLTSARRGIVSELISQNETEAVLHTSGWSYRINDWYFYFRKVDYPADPQIHGNWEWAGIYFGDTL